MKLSALIAILMAGATSMFAMNDISTENTRCRELAKAPSSISADLRVAQDLVNGAWLTSSKSKYEFTENGSLAVFSKNKKGEMTAEVSTWNVDIVEGTPVLLINDKKAGTELFHVRQTCDGLNLVSVTTHDMMTLEYVSVARPGFANDVKANLPGEWTNVSLIESKKNCDNSNGSYLNYSFGENGRYRIDYGSRTSQELEEGSWSISKDGQFLLLTNTLGMTSVIRIAQVDNHGLILEQIMKTNDINEYFCSVQTSFAFIK